MGKYLNDSGLSYFWSKMKSVVLTKTNNTPYTPTADYHPATKKFVEDSLSGAGLGDMLKSVYDSNDNNQADKADDADKLGGQLPDYYQQALSAISQAEAEAGVATTNRLWTALRVKQAIQALAPTDIDGGTF